MEDYIVQLRKMRLFEGIDEKELKPMLQCLGGRVRTFHKGEFVTMVDEPIKRIGVVIKGGVQMIKEDAWGSKVILTFIEEQGIFGETFVCGEYESATVAFYAIRDSVILFLPFKKVMNSCTTSCVFHHHLIENMVAMIARKNYQLMEKVEITSKKTLREKILTYLSLQQESTSADGFEIPLKRMELAEYLCADRSALTRELYKMKEEGLIDFQRNQFKLLK